MDPNTPSDEDAAMQAGFDSTEDGQSDQGSQSTATTEATQPAGQQEAKPTEQPASGQSEPPAVDPFEGLPEAARKLLAEVPTLQTQLAATEERARRAEGQVRSLQGRFDKLSEAPAPQQAPKLDKLQHARDTLGAEMPEVMDALEELAGLLPPAQSAPPVAASPTPAPAQQPAHRDPEIDAAAKAHLEALDAVRPDWFDTLDSPDCKLFVTTKPELAGAYPPKTAGDALRVLGEFDRHRQSLQTATSRQATQVASHASRVAAAVVPTGHAKQPTGKRVLSEEEAMNLGFNS